MEKSQPVFSLVLLQDIHNHYVHDCIRVAGSGHCALQSGETLATREMCVWPNQALEDSQRCLLSAWRSPSLHSASLLVRCRLGTLWLPVISHLIVSSLPSDPGHPDSGDT